jgi:hypothetical protein
VNCLEYIYRSILVFLEVFLLLLASAMIVSPAYASYYDSFQLAESQPFATNDPPTVINLTGEGTGPYHLFFNTRVGDMLSVDCTSTCVDPFTDKIFNNASSNNILEQWLIGDKVVYKTFGSSISGLIDSTSYYLANISPVISPVPVPAAGWLFGTALIGFVGLSRKTKVS